MRAFALIGVFALAFNSYQAWNGIKGSPPLDEVAPAGLVTLSVAHLLFRLPYRRWSKWEAPLVLVSIGLAAFGALTFRPYDQPPEFGFQLFFAAFVGLAVSYGFFCSAVPKHSPLHAAIIEPTKKFSSFGLPGLDIGLVFAPFVFLALLLGYAFRGSSGKP
jgi:hypothetical protein